MIRQLFIVLIIVLLPFVVSAQAPVDENTESSNKNTDIIANDLIMPGQNMPENGVVRSRPMAENGMIPADGVTVRVLDKVTARVKSMTIANDDYRRLGDVIVRPRACQKSDPLEAPESAAFLEIWQFDTDQDPQWVFSGWMFASSPAISSMNHPVYDIWVVECANDVPPFIGPRRPFPTTDG